MTTTGYVKAETSRPSQLTDVLANIIIKAIILNFTMLRYSSFAFLSLDKVCFYKFASFGPVFFMAMQ